MKKYFAFTLIICLIVTCTSSKENSDLAKVEPMLVGLDGREFFEPPRSPEVQAILDSNLLVARTNFENDSSEENYIWLGRREAYLSHYKEAIRIFSDGISKFPESYRLYRHRGHRYISIREFAKAIADFQQAAALMPRLPLETEPDGQPNKLNIPLSTTQFNVWYHLGLAHYLKGDFESAEQAYIHCLDVSNNDDLMCATADWLYMTYKRMGHPAEALRVLDLITDSMNIIENDSYYLRLQMYKGEISPDSLLNIGADNEDVDLALATQGYGVGNWYLCKGDTTRAQDVFRKVTEGKHFAAFGFIAAEADLARLPKTNQ